MWCAGKNPFGEPWQTEAYALLAVLQEHLAQGGTLQTFTYRPTVRENPEGIVYGGEMPLVALEDYVKLFHAIEAGASRTAVDAWMAKTAATHVADMLTINPLTWDPSARELDALRRHTAALCNAINSMLRRKADAALEGHSNADETP
jgi:hypothetical protein